MKKQLLKTFFAFAMIASLLIPLAACTVEQTEEGELPEVEVEAEGGNLPEYDVDTAEVEVGTETKEVEVTVPDVDVEMPDEEADEGDDGGHDANG